MSDCSQYQRLLPLMVSGELEEGEEQRLQNHVRVCDRCAAELDELRSLLGLVRRAPRYEPDDALLARARAQLQLRLRQGEHRGRASEWLLGVRDWFENIGQQVPRLAAATAMLAAGVLAGHYLWPSAPQRLGGEPSRAAAVQQRLLSATAEAPVASIRFDPQTGLVEVRTIPREPVTLRGRPQDEGIRQVLTEALARGDPSLRLRAIKALGTPARFDQNVIDALLRALKTDTTLGVRLKVIDALEPMLSEAQVRDALIWTLLHDPSEVVRMETIRVLSLTARPAEVAPVLERSARKDSSAAVRTRARRAIRRLQNPNSPGRL